MLQCSVLLAWHSRSIHRCSPDFNVRGNLPTNGIGWWMIEVGSEGAKCALQRKNLNNISQVNSFKTKRSVSPFSITPVKRAHKARTCWYHRPFCLIYQYQVKEKKKKKEWTDTIHIYWEKKKWEKKCILANTSAIWQQAAHTTYQLSSPSCSTRAIQKSLTLNEKYLSFLEKSQENGPLAEKWQDRKGKCGDRKEKREDRKGESNYSPEIPDRRRTSDIPGLPSGRETERR